MELALAVLLTGTIIVAAGYVAGTAATQQSKGTGAKGTGQPAGVLPSVAVEVIAVDPQAKTITVRDVAAVPAPAGKAVEVTLPCPRRPQVRSSATPRSGKRSMSPAR